MLEIKRTEKLSYFQNLKNVFLIYYQSWGLHFSDRGWWTSEMDQEIEDYNLKENLIKLAIENNYSFIVLKANKNKNTWNVVKTGNLEEDNE